MGSEKRQPLQFINLRGRWIDRQIDKEMETERDEYREKGESEKRTKTKSIISKCLRKLSPID